MVLGSSCASLSSSETAGARRGDPYVKKRFTEGNSRSSSRDDLRQLVFVLCRNDDEAVRRSGVAVGPADEEVLACVHHHVSTAGARILLQTVIYLGKQQELLRSLCTCVHHHVRVDRVLARRPLGADLRAARARKRDPVVREGGWKLSERAERCHSRHEHVNSRSTDPYINSDSTKQGSIC